MRLPDRSRLYTTPCGIRIKSPSGRRNPLYDIFYSIYPEKTLPEENPDPYVGRDSKNDNLCNLCRSEPSEETSFRDEKDQSQSFEEEQSWPDPPTPLNRQNTGIILSWSSENGRYF